MKIKKAVIPAAGHGTRFLPATKAQPKEMLPIIDTPTIQYVVEEAVESGIEDIIIITGRGKRAIENHFDRNFELETLLENKKSSHALMEIRRTADFANIHFIRQKESKGLGDAIYCARHHVGDEPFAVLLGDTIVDSIEPAVQQLMEVFSVGTKTVVGVEEVPREKVSRYGIVNGQLVGRNLREIEVLVEKPTTKEAPSTLAIAGRYVLTPGIFAAIEKTPPRKNQEIQLTDALMVLRETEEIYSFTIEGKRYDIGNKLDYLKTQVEYGLMRKEFSKPFLRFLKEMIGKHDTP